MFVPNPALRRTPAGLVGALLALAIAADGGAFAKHGKALDPSFVQSAQSRKVGG